MASFSSLAGHAGGQRELGKMSCWSAAPWPLRHRDQDSPILDEWIDDVGLMLLLHLDARLHTPVRVALTHHGSADGTAVRRHLVDHRQIQVAIEVMARVRGIGVAVITSTSGSNPCAVSWHAAGRQSGAARPPRSCRDDGTVPRHRAKRACRRATAPPPRNAFQELLAASTFHGAGQQRYLQVKRAEQSAERGQMLLRQNFGRGHEGAWKPLETAMSIVKRGPPRFCHCRHPLESGDSSGRGVAYHREFQRAPDAAAVRRKGRCCKSTSPRWLGCVGYGRGSRWTARWRKARPSSSRKNSSKTKRSWKGV